MRAVILSTVMFILSGTLARAQVSTADLVAQAKKEGRVTWYTTVSIPESKQFMDMFEKQYPFIKVDLLRSGSGPLVNRIASEYAAKTYAADVLQGMSTRGGFTILRQKNIVGRYESPERKYYPSDLKDKEGYWSSTFQNTFVLAYNKRNVKPDDVPRTYEDLLKPIWKGRQIINDTENFEWFDGLLKFWGRDKGLAYFRRLALQEQVFQRGARAFNSSPPAKRRSRSATDRTRKVSSIRARRSNGFRWNLWS
jgi:ABC-type thiamine transport system substrate-binding protein